jgi:polygalacturonase
LSEDVVVRNVIVRNDWFAQNGDGIDIDACRRVVVYNSHFDTGDDAICIKSGAGEAARRRGRAAEDIVIANNTVLHGHGGVTIGSEMSGGVRNVFVDNCVFLGTDEGLRFKSARGRGGIVENLYFRNIYMRGIATDAIGFTMSYGGAGPTDQAASAASATVPKADEGTPVFRQIHFDNIVCVGAKRAVHLEGLPEMPIESVDFNNLTISAETGFETLYAKAVHITGARILPERGPVFRFGETAGLTLDKSTGPASAETFLVLSGARTTGIHLTNAAAPVKFENGAQAGALIR